MAGDLPKGPPRRLVEGGDGSAQSARSAQLLRQVRAPTPTSAERERVWAALRAGREPSRLRWIGTAVPAAVVGFLLVMLLRPQADPSGTVSLATPLAPMTLTLAAGAVSAGPQAAALQPVEAGAELPSGTRVRTGAGSSAHLRFFDSSGLLVREGTEVLLTQQPEGAQIELAAGGIVAAIAPQRGEGRIFAVVAQGVRVEVVGTLFAVESGRTVNVRVAEGVVSVQHAEQKVSVTAGQCWSSDAPGQSVPCPAPPDASAARALTRPAGSEGRVVLEGDGDLAVVADGIALGHPPIQWWTAAREHQLQVTAPGGRLERAVTVAPDAEVRLALVLPLATAPRSAIPEEPSAPTAVAPPIPTPRPTPPLRRLESEPSREPAEPPPAIPLALPPAPPVRGPEWLYEDALRLAREGQYAAAAGAFESLAQSGGDRFGALALYELGRLRHQRLHDPTGALEAFQGYRQRFPAGPLRHEVDLSAVEASLSLGAPDRALGEADAFLAAHPGSERRQLVRRIRGDLRRAAGDCLAAVQDYQAVLDEDPRGPEADDATFHAALCEARLGRAAAARERLERYLAGFPRGRHAAEAAQALGTTRD
ncbi:MAG: FecR domain-containing protein [Deltaproteobacteria bacterium]|nr:FecR domain-containing protein [Deltaproteobacteria bacterium]